MVQLQDLPASFRVTFVRPSTVLHLTVPPCFSPLFQGLSISSLGPSAVFSLLCRKTLLACHKKSGGHHPIAVGEALRRLTSKFLSTAVCHTSFSTLTPLQLGVGIKGGRKAIVHATSHLLSSDLPADQRWTLLLDFWNAFNSINCEAIVSSTATSPSPLELCRHLDS